MCKITCIVGSPNKKGSCSYLIDEFLKSATDKNVEMHKYYISELLMGYCTGCKNCYYTGECIQKDDVKGVVLDILSSDYVVIASPSWWADVPAQLKTLFDRTTPYGDTNPNRKYFANKKIKGIAIAVRAGQREEENEIILNSITHYFGHLGIQTIAKISITETDNLDDLLKNHRTILTRLRALGNELGKI